MSLIVRDLCTDLPESARKLLADLYNNTYITTEIFFNSDNIVCLYYKKYNNHKYAFLSDQYCKNCIIFYNTFEKLKNEHLTKSNQFLYTNICFNIDDFADHAYINITA